MSDKKQSSETGSTIADHISGFRVQAKEKDQYTTLLRDHSVQYTTPQMEEIRDGVVAVLKGKQDECVIWADDLADKTPHHPARERFNKLVIEELSPTLSMHGESHNEFVSESYDWYTTAHPQAFITKTTNTPLSPRNPPDPTEGIKVTWSIVCAKKIDRLNDYIDASVQMKQVAQNQKKLLTAM